MLTKYILIPFLGAAVMFAGCKKLVDVPAPKTYTSASSIYSTDATAASTLTGIYANMSGQTTAHIGIGSLYLYPSLSADELTLYDINNVLYRPYYLNDLSSSNSNGGGNDLWLNLYPDVYYANAAIAGLTNNLSLTPAVDRQLLGEAKFVRAFIYFYLVNLYGDVAMPTGTDYTVNALLPRTPRDQVYQLILSDLRDAKSLLSENFMDATVTKTTMERVRPTTWAASALLARTYLYTQKPDSAEAEASRIIGSSLFALDSLKDVFLANSTEAIWQWQPVQTSVSTNTGEGALFVLPATGPDAIGTYPVYLSDFVVNSFEPNDERRTNWVDSVNTGGTIYHFPNKYKIGTGSGPTTEYSMVLRLAEMYLIRAEARAMQNRLTDAAADLNIIRKRAGLPASAASSQQDLLTAILHERQTELFTEWGHRWLDLKRTGSIDSVMGMPVKVCQAKGGHWDPNWQLYPIPLSELKAEPQLVQNKGY